MKKIKVLTLLIAMALLTSVTASATTTGTVMIGAKSFDLTYANDPVHAEEISNAIIASGTVFIKGFDGMWIDNATGKVVDESVVMNDIKIENAKMETNVANIRNTKYLPLFYENSPDANDTTEMISFDNKSFSKGYDDIWIDDVTGKIVDESSVFEAIDDHEFGPVKKDIPPIPAPNTSVPKPVTMQSIIDDAIMETNRQSEIDIKNERIKVKKDREIRAAIKAKAKANLTEEEVRIAKENAEKNARMDSEIANMKGVVGGLKGKIDDANYRAQGYESGNLIHLEPYENQKDKTTTQRLSCFFSPGFSQDMIDSINLNTGRSFIASDIEGKNKINVSIRAYNVIKDGKTYRNNGTQFLFNEDRKATFTRYMKGGTYYFFITNQYGEYEEFNNGSTPLLHPEATRGPTIMAIMILPK
ncbi:MAG: hypothetical protein ACREV6_02885 [Clostridium sp.]|uniref:hypothetical protein n=1 Tax=Clostridium sp. TaxID=1506 RepID=UPI003D6CF1A9